MKKILVICGAGMTSSILVSKMRSFVAEDRTLDYKIGSCAVNQVEKTAPQADVIFVAPHLAYIADDLRKTYPDKEIYEIDRQLYGNLNGAGVIGLLNTSAKTKTAGALQKVIRRICNSRHLHAISEALYSLLSILIVGSAFTIINNFPYQPYLAMMTGTVLWRVNNAVIFCTTGCISLYMTFLIAYHYGHIRKVSGSMSALNAVICFMLLLNAQSHQLETMYLGTAGMFCAIITAFISVEIFSALDHVSQKFGESIKSLPKAIYRSFLSLIPGFVSIVFFTFVTAVFIYTPYGSFPSFVYQVLQMGISRYISNNIVSMVIAQLMIQLLWFIGIHGGQVVNSVLQPVLMPLAMENVAAYAARAPLPNIIHSQFAMVCIFGGAGSTLGLAVLMAFFAKSQRMRQLGRVALPMGIFFINEPIILGLPVMMNFLMFIPFVIIPIISILSTYFLMAAGIVPVVIGFEIPWTTPIIISGLIQGGWQLVLWQVILFCIQTLIWYPFFRFQDNKYLQDEDSENLPRQAAKS